MNDWRDDLLLDLNGISAYGFEHIISKTEYVPHIDDSAITYPNLVEKTQRSKLLESTVLFVDLRGSTQISMQHDQQTLAALYSAYVRAMTRCGEYFGGHIRNIIGDRVMVVFDRKGCFLNAVNTAILMNSVAKYVLNPLFSYIEVRCGIGIDFGEMLVSKTGIIKQGKENTSNKSLVWLGKPANIASKLTDRANKPPDAGGRAVSEGYYYPLTEQWAWTNVPAAEFIDNLHISLGKIAHRKQYFHALVKEVAPNLLPEKPPILMTDAVLNGLKAEAPDEQSVVNDWWSETFVSVAGYEGKIFGADISYTIFQQ